MTFREYAATTSGRIASVSGAIALIGGGATIFTSSMTLLTAALSLAITGFIAALVIGIRESPWFLLIGVCGLPPIAGIYLALVTMWRADESTTAAIPLIVAGVAALGLAALARRPASS